MEIFNQIDMGIIKMFKPFLGKDILKVTRAQQLNIHSTLF
jgi:methionyl-tRNA formyltransferase